MKRKHWNCISHTFINSIATYVQVLQQGVTWRIGRVFLSRQCKQPYIEIKKKISWPYKAWGALWCYYYYTEQWDLHQCKPSMQSYRLPTCSFVIIALSFFSGNTAHGDVDIQDGDRKLSRLSVFWSSLSFSQKHRPWKIDNRPKLGAKSETTWSAG